MADLLMKIPHNERVYELYCQDITTSKLMQFAQWYGEDYGAYSPFIARLLRFDAAALVCALWTAKSNAGEPSNRETLDLSPFELIKFQQEEAARELEQGAAAEGAASESGPTPPEAPMTTSASTPTA